MRGKRWGAAALIVVAAAAGRADAQLAAPAASPVGVAPAGPAPGAAAVASTADAAAKPGFFKRVCMGLDDCRRKLCKSPAGQLLNNMTKPATALTGGVIPGFCPLMPSEKDLLQPGVSGVASAAQKDALEAKARREAVRFLGTLDCRYYPDAAVALAAALRTDGSECVRFEAAIVLGRGCCCTQKTVEALEATVSGMETDGNPAERSVRVRCAAAIALERCLACYAPPAAPAAPVVEDKGTGEPPPPADSLPGPRPLPVNLPAGNPPRGEQAKSNPPALPPGARLPSRQTVERAKKTLAEFNEMLTAAGPYLSARQTPPSRQSLYHLISGTTESTNPR